VSRTGGDLGHRRADAERSEDVSEDVPGFASGRVEPTVLGFPRIGRDRQLTTALDAYWQDEIDEARLARLARTAPSGGGCPAIL
jgi:hypothetical protein